MRPTLKGSRAQGDRYFVFYLHSIKVNLKDNGMNIIESQKVRS